MFSIEPQQVESVERWRTAARKQLIKLTDAVGIEADDFTVENCILYRQFVERFLQRLEGLEVVQVPRDQFAFAIVDVGERPEAVVLQFKNVIGIVEGLRYQPEPHRLNAW